ncbi:hypothetical protein L3Q82_013753, partial [Scortum barcoo]
MLLRGQDRMKAAADHHRRPAPAYTPGQKVWLSTKDLPLHFHSRKLAPSYVKSRHKNFLYSEQWQLAEVFMARRVPSRLLTPWPGDAEKSGWLLGRFCFGGRTHMKAAADHHHTPTPAYTPGQKVWLSTKDLPLHVHSRKLAPRFVGPFPISKIINPVSFQLKLPRSLRVHPTFHALAKSSLS